MNLKSNWATGHHVCLSHPKALLHQKTLLDQQLHAVELQTGTAGLRPAFPGWCASIVALSVLRGCLFSASTESSVAAAGDLALLRACADLFLSDSEPLQLSGFSGLYHNCLLNQSEKAD